MNTKILQDKFDEIVRGLTALHEGAEGRELNEDEQVRWDQLDTERAEVETKLTEAKAAEERAQRVAESRARWASLQVGGTRLDPFDNLDAVRWGNPEDPALISRALTAVERGLSESTMRRFGITDEHRQSAAKTIELIPGAAQHALLVGSPAYMSAFRAWLQSGGQPLYTPEEAAALRASMSLTSANGGYMLPTLLDPTLIETFTLSKNPIRRISRVETGTQNVWNGVTIGAVTTAWTGEGAAFTDGSPTTGAASVTAAKLTAYVTGSYEIFADSNALSQLPGLITTGIDMTEGVAFVSGSGSGAPKGVITAVSGTAGSLVTCTTRGSFTTASVADVNAVFDATATRYEDSSTWVFNKVTWNKVTQMVVGTGGGKLVDHNVRPRELLTSPVELASSITSTTTSGNILGVLGDFGQFVVYDRIGVAMEIIQNVVDGDGLPVGKRGLLAYKRVGSDVTDVNAFRLLKA